MLARGGVRSAQSATGAPAERGDPATRPSASGSSARPVGSAYWVSGWPELVAEWHPHRNGGLDPRQVSHGSGRKIWWRCPKGPDHEWRATVNNRVAGKTGCPFCAGRLPSVTNSLATQRPDLARQWHPTKNHPLTPNRVVAGSERRVWWKCPVARDHEWLVSPHARLRVEGGCPFCIGHRVSKTNSLASTERRIAREWHPTKNGALTTRNVVAGSARVVWWRCRKASDHEWQASIANRCLRGSGCPFCVGRRASLGHCLATTYPAIAREWHPTRNGDLTPAAVTPHAALVVWWVCAAGHEWRSRVAQRTRRGNRCAVCAASPRVRMPVAMDAGSRAGHGGLHLRREHRRLEQTLVLLAGDPEVDRPILARIMADVAANLATKEALVYPVVEGAEQRPLLRQREMHQRIRILLSKALRCRAGLRWPCLHNLSFTFREHTRVVEQEILPVLECALAAPALSALEGRMREFRARSLEVGFGLVGPSGSRSAPRDRRSRA